MPFVAASMHSPTSSGAASRVIIGTSIVPIVASRRAPARASVSCGVVLGIRIAAR